ncbi:MAG: cell division ATP-binding protein FtsE [Candidatus Nealsonbacteria bacterium CG_4_10_14_0_2_um_filter_38_17]|uniref:Cell division ATP-binding protein FtsE n=2 Tax=Candidatus Nealsoniibacteriota TaxID=1817911 RepID=A0A2M7UY63_9BACT|nr:MAG: cell division ATP-binding protein FtsE [Candidatus Nealsonbacteria bacterium CG23_combo_of_CG06-09_8_20_14_all_38_19]PIZ88923.1 MAG: cell division ATP-binding protein FtsE [Candidatus Nealsonbacteria bacterium CG_4_10_14_0_2_um_filter_38_17]
MIKFQTVTKIYPFNTIALDNVSFEVQPKEFISIVGKSGSGKTTLLKLLMAEEKPTRGRIFFEDQDIHKMKKSRLPRLRRKIGTVFQDYKLLPSKTAFENIAYVMEVMGASDKEIERDVPEVLEVVGLADKANNFPLQLSGGERQRVAIARALIHRPEVILADEPTGNLDPYNTSDIIKLLLRINELGTTVILATHNKGIINSLGRRVITLENGKVVRDEEKGKFRL